MYLKIEYEIPSPNLLYASEEILVESRILFVCLLLCDRYLHINKGSVLKYQCNDEFVNDSLQIKQIQSLPNRTNTVVQVSCLKSKEVIIILSSKQC